MHRIRVCSTQKTSRRRGFAAVECALTLPIFVMFLAALMEFGHVFMVSHMLKAAAKSGARYGSTLGVTNAQVTAKVQQMISSVIDPSKATILVQSAAIFDTSTVTPSSINYTTLPAIDLTQCDEGDLYVVRVTVPYNSVALLPPFWVINQTVAGQSVMRHE